MVGAIGLAMTGVTALATDEVAALTTAGVAGLPGQAGANINQSRRSCYWMLDQFVQATGATDAFGPCWMSSLN